MNKLQSISSINLRIKMTKRIIEFNRAKNKIISFSNLINFKTVLEANNLYHKNKSICYSWLNNRKNP